MTGQRDTGYAKDTYLELVWYKGLADLQAEAARAYVGFLWWVLEPLLYMMAFYVAFGPGMRGGGGPRGARSCSSASCPGNGSPARCRTAPASSRPTAA